MAKKSLRGRLNGEPNPIDLYVGNRVRMFRTLKGMSQQELGRSLGLTFQQVQKYEKGLNRIGASRLWDISQVLETPIGLFYEDIPTEADSLSPRHINLPSNQSTDSLEQTILACDNNPLMRKETMELVRIYYQIADRNMAHKALELLKAMAYTDDNSSLEDAEEKK